MHALPKTFKPIWPAIKWGAFLVVLAFVAWHAWTLWNRFDAAPGHLNWSWLALAAVASVVAWLPSMWYWRWLMACLGAAAPWPQVARAYYCGQLGKYVPGKGAAIVIRAALLKQTGVPGATAALAVTQETLTCMWAGGLTALLLYPSLAPHLPALITAHAAAHWLVRVGLLAGVVCAGAALLTMLIRSHRLLSTVFGSPRRPGSSIAETPVPAAAGGDETARAAPGAVADQGPHREVDVPQSLKMTIAGGVVFLATWWIHGLTLGLTIRGVIGERAAWSDWPFWTGTAAVALVGGFVAFFAPGGLGVREGLLMELLERQLGPREAVLVTVLWRGTSLVSEILAAGALYYGVAGVDESKGSGGPRKSGVRISKGV